MNLTLHIWRQKMRTTRQNGSNEDVSPDSSFLEMLDELNQEIIAKGEEPVIFDHDCRGADHVQW